MLPRNVVMVIAYNVERTSATAEIPFVQLLQCPIAYAQLAVDRAVARRKKLYLYALFLPKHGEEL